MAIKQYFGSAAFLVIIVYSSIGFSQQEKRGRGFEFTLIQLCTRSDVQQKIGLNDSQIEAASEKFAALSKELSAASIQVMRDPAIPRDKKNQELAKVMLEVSESGVDFLAELLTPKQEEDLIKMYLLDMIYLEGFSKLVMDTTARAFLQIDDEQLVSLAPIARTFDQEYRAEVLAIRDKKLKAFLEKLRPDQKETFEKVLKN